MEGNVRRIVHYITARHGNASAVGFLVDDGTLEVEFTVAGLQHQVAGGIDRNLLCSGDLQLNPARICTGRNCEIIFQLLMASVIDQINARVDILVAHLRVGWNIRAPLSRISSDKVIHFADLRIFAHDCRIARGSH